MRDRRRPGAIVGEALLDGDIKLAESVENRDDDIDRREVEIEEECLKILALYQPVAIDLRFIVAAMKINNDLERIGDLAVNIARKAESFAAEPSMSIPFDIAGMSEKTQAMLRDSLDALVNMDGPLAADVCRRDDEVDRIKREIRVGGRRADSPRAAERASFPAVAGRLPQPRAHRRLRHEHRRGRHLHVRRPHHPPQQDGLGPALGFGPGITSRFR